MAAATLAACVRAVKANGSGTTKDKATAWIDDMSYDAVGIWAKVAAVLVVLYLIQPGLALVALCCIIAVPALSAYLASTGFCGS
jgi:hypothetical protein